jgi:hypothetical protein
MLLIKVVPAGSHYEIEAGVDYLSQGTGSDPRT